jgi:hypothetical protein
VSYYYDRAGQPLTMWQWAVQHEGDELRRVARTTLVLDGVEADVSTVWLGLDHNWGDGPPLIFETMIFGLKGRLEDYCERYATEADAQAGHDRIVAALTEGRLTDLLCPDA